jgi:hypothetical protein
LSKTLPTLLRTCPAFRLPKLFGRLRELYEKQVPMRMSEEVISCRPLFSHVGSPANVIAQAHVCACAYGLACDRKPKALFSRLTQEFWSKFFEARRLHTGKEGHKDDDEALPEMAASQSTQQSQVNGSSVAAAGAPKPHVRKEVDLTAIEAPSLMTASTISKGAALTGTTHRQRAQECECKVCRHDGKHERTHKSSSS